jgi:hypothetical protein
MRHDKVCAHLHYSTSKALGFETTKGTHTHTRTHAPSTHARTHTPKPVYEGGDVAVLWNQAGATDTELQQTGQT